VRSFYSFFFGHGFFSFQITEMGCNRGRDGCTRQQPSKATEPKRKGFKSSVGPLSSTNERIFSARPISTFLRCPAVFEEALQFGGIPVGQAGALGSRLHPVAACQRQGR
jgi:hypothetical protein